MKKFILFGIAFQMAVLFSLLFFAYAPLYFGQEIKLQARGVDPRDLFLGNYAYLNYDVSVVHANKEYNENEPIYLSLKKDKNLHVSSYLSTSKPKGEYLKGRVKYCSKYGKKYKVYLIFGVEKYFSTAENSKKLEKMLRDKNATVTLGVLNGLARIKSVQVQ